MNFFSIVDYEIIFNHVGSIAFTFDNTTSTVLPSSLNNLIAHDWPKINNLTNYITMEPSVLNSLSPEVSRIADNP